jgi:hypothetical protein
MSFQLDQHIRATVFEYQLDELADTLARIRRRLGDDEYTNYLIDVASGHVEMLDAMTWCSAGELVRRGIDVDEAIEAVWGRADQLRSRLGITR